ncbi:ABC transporter substrate-binding protein [Guggenheimella bovis]
MMRSKHSWATKFTLFFLVIAMLMMTSGCGSKDVTTGEGSTGKDEIKFGLASEPNKLDPMAIATMSTFSVTYAIYDNLVEENEKGDFVPSLAEKIDVSNDGLTYTMDIRKNVKFHDGSPLTADDVVFSINRTIEKGWAFDMTAFIDKVEKVDDFKVVMKLKRPFGGMMGSLASPYFSIMSKAYIDKNGDEIVERKPMGTGAYKFVEWLAGTHIKLEANEEYWQGAPKIKKVTFQPVTDKNTGLISLQTGSLDAYLNVNYIDIPNVQKDQNLQFSSTESASVLSLDMNVEKTPLDNVKVRQAINYAINRQNVIDGALEGIGKVANSAIPPTVAGYSAETKGFEYDVEKAKSLLSEAGYNEQNPLKLKLKIKEDAKVQKVAQVIQNDLKQVNIEIDIEIMEAGKYSTDINTNGDYELTLISWTAMFPDAYSLLYSQFHKDTYGSTGNITHVVDENLSKALDDAAQVDDSKKVEAYSKITKMLIDNAYVANLVYEPTTITANKDLLGIEANSLGIYKIKRFSWK